MLLYPANLYTVYVSFIHDFLISILALKVVCSNYHSSISNVRYDTILTVLHEPIFHKIMGFIMWAMWSSIEKSILSSSLLQVSHRNFRALYICRISAIGILSIGLLLCWISSLIWRYQASFLIGSPRNRFFHAYCITVVFKESNLAFCNLGNISSKSGAIRRYISTITVASAI